MAHRHAIAKLSAIVGFCVCTAVLVKPTAALGDDTADALAARAREVLARRCFGCHGLNGVAQKNIFVLDYQRLIGSRAVEQGNGESLLLRVVESGAMPMGGPALSTEEKATLRTWVIDGAPEWKDEAREPAREFLSQPIIDKLMLDDLSAADPRTRPFLRYLTIAHLFNAGVPEADLEITRAAISKLINSLSWHPQLTAPRAIDSARTVFRIDLRDYDWTTSVWNALSALYPYGVRTPDSRQLTSQTGAEISSVRGDWFVTTASVPPLYHEILGLPRTLSELERRLGVDVSRNIDEEKNVVRAGMRASGVSQNNRVVERHISANGAYWQSYDFRNNLGNQNIFRDPINLRPAGGEVIFSLPNGLQAYYLADGRGVRIDRAPIEIVSDRNNPDDPVIQNGRSCMTCHYGGIKEFRDDVRSMIDASSPASFDVSKARALYPEQKILDQYLAQDSARFGNAVSQLGASAGKSADEPVNVVSRRFLSELSIENAAAETGLEVPRFRSRLSASARLAARGFGQLATVNGGIKRDAWDRHFREVVREFQLGEPVVGRDFLASMEGQMKPRERSAGRAAAVAIGLAALRLKSPHAALLLGVLARARRNAGGAGSPDAQFRDSLIIDAVRNARSVFIMSRTEFFKPADLATALAKRREWSKLGLAITEDQSTADLIIQVQRRPLSTEFPYVVVDSRSGVAVCSGSVRSLFGTVAGKIASNFVKQLIVRRVASD
jgi:mono/diheme cytochrome c family protein